MKIYEPGVNSDLLLTEWWTHLGLSGDLERAFTVDLAPLGAFLMEWRNISALMYEVDEQGSICKAAWVERVMSGGFYGLWIREDQRDSSSLAFVLESTLLCLQRFPVLIYVTRSRETADTAIRFGANEIGEVPHIFDGQAAIVLSITSEDLRRVHGEHLKPPLIEVANG